MMIRTSSLTDLDSVFELEKQFGAEAFNRKSLRRFILSGSLLVFVDNFDVVIGSAILLRRKNSDKIRLYSFIVDQKFRGKGVGRAYLHALLERDLGASGMILEVSETNHPAIGLYTKAGFQPTQRLENYYRDGSGAIKMFKKLSK